jgi:hypothetical protein
MRRWFLIAIIPLVALLALGLWLAWGGPNRVTRANFDRIELGMTRTQVDELLAQSFRVEQNPRVLRVDAMDWGGHFQYQQHILFYSDKEPNGLVPTNIITVTLENDTVTSKNFQPWTFADLVRRLRGRLSL